jgi:hypothetical protein
MKTLFFVRSLVMLAGVVVLVAALTPRPAAAH